MGLREFRKKIGPVDHQRHSKYFSDHEILAPDLLVCLRENSGLPRYAMWMNITADVGDRDVNRRERVSYRTETDSEGNTERVVDSVEYETKSSASRYVSFTASIYEVQTERRIWHAKAARSRSNTATATSSFRYPPARPVIVPGAFEVMEPALEELAVCLRER